MSAHSGSAGDVMVATSGVEGTRRVGAALASHLRAGDVVLLEGPLGAGKTALVQGAAAALGVAQPVTSPTFVIVASYTTSAGTGLLHVDLYRLDDLAEVIDLGLGELLEEDALAFVEWGARAEGSLGPDALHVVIDPVAQRPDDRRMSVAASGSAWAERWPALRHTLLDEFPT